VKTYTLELTAEELKNVEAVRGRACPPALVRKLYELADQARADCEVDELLLPWTAQKDDTMRDLWLVIPHSYRGYGERAAKLASAAPELLSAVQAWEDYDESEDAADEERARRLTERALRKIETGTPEPL
jgi:hypothetical protein